MKNKIKVSLQARRGWATAAGLDYVIVSIAGAVSLARAGIPSVPGDSITVNEAEKLEASPEVEVTVWAHKSR